MNLNEIEQKLRDLEERIEQLEGSWLLPLAIQHITSTIDKQQICGYCHNEDCFEDHIIC